MGTQPMVCSTTSLELKPAPINPNWILDGTPTARAAELSRSADETATTLVWECSPGKFRWIYDTDETIHILQGSITLDDGHGPVRQLGPGDVVFFPAGAAVHWHVQSHVRKLAFFRRVMPKPIELMTRSLRRARNMMRASKAIMVGKGAVGQSATTTIHTL